MAITKTDLNQALKKQEKNIISQISEFLEEHVIKRLFRLEKDVSVLKKDVGGLKKDVGGLKKDVKGLKEDMTEVKQDLEQIDRRLEKSIDRADRHGTILENHEKRINRLATTKFA